MYHVLQQYSELDDGGIPDIRELVRVLQQFMESSTLGEFSTRLKIIHSFYCQMVIDEGVPSNSGDS